MSAPATTWTEKNIIIQEIRSGRNSFYELTDVTSEYIAAFQPNWHEGTYSDGWLVMSDWTLINPEKMLVNSLPGAIRCFGKWLKSKKSVLWV